MYLFERGLFLMKSLCVKSNNTDIVIYLLDKFNNFNKDSLIVSNRKFKIYENVIVHFKDNNLDFLYDKISSILTDSILLFFEDKLLRRILEYNYFYFTSPEKRKILKIAKNFIENDSISREDNFFAIYYAIHDYIKNNNSLVLDGFVNFRLNNYMKNLDYIIDISVNKFLIEKEYDEFINILKFYVSANKNNSPLIHLIYNHSNTVLLDKNKNIIPISDDILNTKYLSDISFSSNDYILNTLLCLNPRKLIIHDFNREKDEFITTLVSIFENSVEICNDCDICSLYSKIELKTN